MSVHITIGQLVTSTAGRDNGHVYMVVGIGKLPFVLLADGRERKIVKPKKKNIRHVNVLKSSATGVAEKLRSGNNITDEDIRQALALLPDNL